MLFSVGFLKLKSIYLYVQSIEITANSGFVCAVIVCMFSIFICV